ncbi:hypothetical protein SDRG_03114 [Saprolegnia diclina VS20]|uniref:Uncharacterized protein n=1 Tax=Saprolegnia diclina (strain VS20) TaxID=1156394 RepID=T0QYC1_SAPDV|nr:hypothetical protein SDRG_03114 [Saprolegnia diclina VS20]EQC39686.1 hypothetical protein SDRG_03114 [Saprolegnia diclina VS20]|eukprot:XP_008606958.1 hypothetical protein SDRG_03114 [Saprolegnia diclina VS20]
MLKMMDQAFVPLATSSGEGLISFPWSSFFLAGASRTSGVVVLSQLVRPEFKSIARRDVVVWKRARLEYKTSMQRKCQRTNRCYAATCAPVRDSFAPMGYFEFLMKTSWDRRGDYSLLNVPEDKLWEEINGIIDK